MDKKNLSIISYITIIGWLYVYITTNHQNRDSLVKYHLKQSLGLIIVSFLFSIVLSILVSIVPALYFINFLSLGFLILWILGIINAANSAEKPVPAIGKMFEDKFDFIK